MRRVLLTATMFFICHCTISAQFYKSVIPSPEFTSSLEKVVLDFRFNFMNIKGDSLLQDGGTETFESTIKLPGSGGCTITYYSSRVDTTASWQATMYSGPDFDLAVTAYRNLFRLVRKSHLNWIDRTLMRFTGSMENPKPEVGFANSTLRLDVEDVRYKKFAAEVELVSGSYGNFEVHLNLQNKKQDDERF